MSDATTASAMLTPFQISIPQSELDDLHVRLARTRWPNELADAEWTDGMLPSGIHTLVDRWSDGFDWRAVENELNRYPQFVTEIDGTTVHTVSARSESSDAVALLLLHGWPSSFAEFHGIIGDLVEPGGENEPAFHVATPSLPGFGFSGPTPDRGWNAVRMARAIAELMTRLGHERFIVHGGDTGLEVANEIALAFPDRVIGLHLNLGGVRLAGENKDTPTDDAVELRAIERYREYDRDKSAYAVLQRSRPQTLAYALTDTPVGQLAWIAEKMHEWADPAHPVAADDVLTTAAIYWFTRTSGSSARFYQEAFGKWGVAEPIRVPTAVAAFPHDIVPPIRRWAEPRYPEIVRWVVPEAGGHFAAFETPNLVIDALRRFAELLQTDISRRSPDNATSDDH
ncbi:MAG: hypothetical protein JWO98_2186 [Frankiales bacterium]|nr:hypothetical protein [Frankiales bacterium]